MVYNHTAEGSELGPTLSFRGLDNAQITATQGVQVTLAAPAALAKMINEESNTSVLRAALTEVQEFRAYSSDLAIASEVVEQLSTEIDDFRVWRRHGLWVAAFGKRPPSFSRSAPVAR